MHSSYNIHYLYVYISIVSSLKKQTKQRIKILTFFSLNYLKIENNKMIYIINYFPILHPVKLIYLNNH